MATELEILCDYVKNEIGYNGPLSPDVDLLDTHILDSFNVVEVAMFIQERFKIELEAEDLVRSNLATLSSMVALIDKRRTAGGQ